MDSKNRKESGGSRLKSIFRTTFAPVSQRSSTTRTPAPSTATIAEPPFGNQLQNPPPRNQFGLNTVFEPNDPSHTIVDLVFVHGLGGGSDKTWSQPSNPDFFWPGRWLPDDSDFEGVRIHSFGYNADWRSLKPSPLDVHAFGESLVEELVNHPRLNSQDTSIVLVGHSMGGLVIKKACILSKTNPDFAPLGKRLRSFYFLGTPHRGSNLASTLKNILRALGTEQRYVAGLEKQSELIRALNDQFRIHYKGIEIHTFYETKPTRSLGLVVDQESATLGYMEERPQLLNASHRELVKFEDQRDSNYRSLRNRLANTITKIRADRIGAVSPGPSARPPTLPVDRKPALTESDIAGKDRFPHTYLGTTDPRDVKTDIQQTRGRPLKESYGWILDHSDFRKWRDAEDTRLLWIKGDPGKGKTMLLCGVIDELEPETKLRKPDATSLLSYFFCQATVDKLSNAQAVLRGLLYMLVNKQQPSLRSHVQDKFNDTGEPRFADAEAWPALCNIFLDVLRDPNLQKIYLVVDALDECVEDQDKLLKFVLQEAQLPHVKWIISSRNNITQNLKLNDCQSILSLELQENAESVLQAIGAYITERISRIESLQSDASLHEHVCQVLHQKAEGTFLWVALVINELENVDSWDVREVVDDVPKGLDELYARMMEHISRLQRRDPEYCRHVLLAATLAYRPLQLLELGVVAGLPDAISSKAEYIRKIVNKSGSFLTVRNQTVAFVHQSAKDYLVNKGASTIFPSGPAGGHRDIFQRSLGAMTRPYGERILLRRDIYGLGHPGTLIDDVQVPSPDPLASIRYSCEFWADHLCFSNGENPECSRELMDDGRVLKFLKEHFLHWLESLSLMKNLSNGVQSIRKLLNTAQTQKVTNSRLIGFLQDAEKFVLSNRSIIERAPLQTYGSALVFSPEMSEVKIQQWQQKLSFINTISGIRSRWGAHQQTLEGHSSYVTAVAFSPDGKTLASASYDNTIRLWDAATGAHQQTLEGHSDYVNAVAFSECGGYLKTNQGILNIKGVSANPNPTTLNNQEVTEACFFVGDEWVEQDGKKLLWLPPEYRPTCSAVEASTIVIGCYSGLVLVMRFQTNNNC